MSIDTNMSVPIEQTPEVLCRETVDQNPADADTSSQLCQALQIALTSTVLGTSNAKFSTETIPYPEPQPKHPTVQTTPDLKTGITNTESPLSLSNSGIRGPQVPHRNLPLQRPIRSG